MQGSFFGMLDDVLIYVYLCGIVLLSVQIEIGTEAFGDNLLNFTIGMSICCCCLLILHIYYYKYVKAAQKYAERRIMSFGIAFAIQLMGYVLLKYTFFCLFVCLVI